MAPPAAPRRRRALRQALMATSRRIIELRFDGGGERARPNDAADAHSQVPAIPWR